MSNSNQQTIGCGGAVALAIFFVLFISKCGGEPEDTISSLDYDIRSLTDDIHQKKRLLIRLKSACESEFPLLSPRDEGRQAQAAWDAAAAENLDNISPEQVWEIRRSLGAELGIAPSEVDGWRQIYLQRAEASRRALDRDQARQAIEQRDWDADKDQRCSKYESGVREIEGLEAEENGLRAKRKKMMQSAG
jgi:hypothetical protein